MTKHISHTCGARSCGPRDTYTENLSSSTHSHISERCLATALRVNDLKNKIAEGLKYNCQSYGKMKKMPTDFANPQPIKSQK